MQLPDHNGVRVVSVDDLQLVPPEDASVIREQAGRVVEP